MKNSKQLTDYQNVYIPILDGQFHQELAVWTKKAPQKEWEYLDLLRVEMNQLAKQEKTTVSELDELVGNLTNRDQLLKTGANVEEMIEELMMTDEVRTKLGYLEIPATRQPSKEEKERAKEWLEQERTLWRLLEIML